MNVFSEARHRLKINVRTLYIGVFVGLALLFALPTPSFAQSGENAATGTSGCVDWNDGPGQLTNSTSFIVEVDMCGGNNGHLLPGQTSNDNLKDIEVVWGLCDTSGDGLCAYRTLGNKNIPITKRYNISRYSYGPPSYGILPSANEERDPDWQSPQILPTYRVVQDVFFLPKFVLYFGKEHVSPMWDTLANTELNLSSAQKSSLNSIWLQDYRSMLLTNTASGRQRCIWYSLNDISMDQFPGGNSSMGLKNNIDRIQTFGDNTCGGLDRNQDGIVDSTSCPATLASTVVASAFTTANDSCGTSPIPQPGVTPQPPPSDNPNNPGSKIVLCKGENFTNCRYELTVGWYEIPQGEYNSISIPSGWSFILVDRSDGHQSCYNTSLPKLVDHETWKFNIGQIGVVDSNVCISNGGGSQPEPLGNSQVRYWTRAGYSGSSLAIHFTDEQNTYWLKDFTGPGFSFNDDIESFELNTSNNRSMALYRDSELQGPAKCFTSSDNDLNNDTFNDGNTVLNQASSARFFVGIGCDLRPQVPSEIWVHAADKSKVVLTWPWGGPDDDGYYIYLFDGNTYQRVATISKNDARQNATNLGQNEYIRSWTFTNVACGGEYSFAVSSWNEFGESEKTHSVRAKSDCDCNDPTFNGVGLYDLRYCQGDNVQLTNPGWYILSDFNDRSSSIYIKPGWSIEVFENSSNVDGLTNCFNQNMWDMSYDNYWLQPVAVDGTISNVRVWNVPNCGRSLPIVGCDALTTTDVTIFDHTHCLGLDKALNAPGFYPLDDFDDITSSIFIPPGKSARLYVNKNKGGNYLCVKDTKWDMKYDPYWLDNTQDTFNNVSAVEVFNDSLCGGIVKPTILFPTATDVISDVVPVNFSWVNSYAGGYWAELWGPAGFFKSSGHLTNSEWFVGELQPGQHTFRVLSEVFGISSEWVEVTFNVIDTTPTPEMVVNYSLDPNQINRVTFTTVNCVGQWVHVDFGHDGLSTDSPCVNGQSATEHDYPYAGEAATFDVVVGSIPVVVNLPRLKDCGELKPTTGISLFAEKDCRGDRRYFAQIGSYELSTYNDQATAILVAPNWSVEVFEHSNSTDGNAYCVTRDIWDLSFESYYATQGYKLDNTISNIRVYNNSTCGKEFPQYGGCDANIAFNGIVLFDYKHCGGTEQKFDKAGKFELGYGGSFNDLATSAHIAPGWSVQVFADSGWKGDQVCLHTNDKWDFGVDKYWNSQKLVNNSVSSVEVFKNNACTQDAPPPPVKPNTPTNLLPSGGEFELGKTITLQWAAVTGASYKIEISGTEQLTFTPTVNQQSFTPQKTGSFSWRVKALKDGLESDWSTTAVFSIKKTEQPPAPAKPVAPTNLLQSAVTQNTISFDWNDNSTNEMGFVIMKWNGQQFIEIFRVGANVTSHTDVKLKCGTTYKYAVSAFNAVGESLLSQELQISTAKCDGDTTPKDMIFLPLVTR